MKKITKSLIFLAASAMAFASCAKEEAPVSTPIEGSIRVRFVADAALTKVGLNPNDGDTEFTASWDDDDQIAITSFVSGGAMKETKGASWSGKYFSTEFKASDYTEGPYDFVGVWPVGKDADKLFPAERHQNGAAYNGEYDIMKSSRTSSATLSQDATIVLDMVRQTSIAYFHITSALNEKIVSATLTTDKPIASSNATLNYTGFEPNVETNGENSIKLIIDGEEMSSSDFKLWFNVLPVNYGTMTLRVETANHSFSLEKKTGGEWKAGELNKVIIPNVPAEKWAEIERPTGETTETLTMTEKKASDGVITFENGNIKAEFNKNSGSNDPAWVSNAIRLYAKGTVKVTEKNGYSLKSVKFNAIVNENKDGKKPTPTVNGNAVSVVDGNISWTGDATEVVLLADGTAGNIAISSIEVTYSDPNAGTDPIYKYSVMVDPEIENGTINIVPASAAAGTTVTLTPAPADGYEFVTGSLKATNAVSGEELTLEDNKFTMPAANVNVTAQFSLIPTLFATSPEPYASNWTDKGGEGFSIPVTANQAWVAATKADDPNLADITLMTAEGEGGEDNNLVFKFNSQNESPLVAKSTVVVLSPKEGNRPEPVEITITHDKRGATLVLNNDDKANVTANVTASETSYTVNITNANFSEWSVLEYKIGDVAQATTGTDCVTTHTPDANTGSVSIKFPANASDSDDVTITLKVGYTDIITKTLTLTQAAAVVRTPNVTLDFSTNTWNLPEGSANKTTESTSYSNDSYSITLAGGGDGNGHYFNAAGYLMLGKSGAIFIFPAFDFDVDRIKIYGNSAASSSVKQNIYVGETAVSTETEGAQGINTYDITSGYQAAGNVYALKIGSAHNTQITKIEIFGGASKTLKSITVSGTPTKTTYTAGETFDPTGLTVTGTYDDATTALLTNVEWEFTPTTLSAGTTSVSVVAKKGDVTSNTYQVSGLTVNAVQTYSITEYSSAQGSVTANVSTSQAGATITLTITPESPNILKSIKVHKDGDESTTVELSGSGNTRTFTMPAYDVVVSAEFGQGGGDPQTVTYKQSSTSAASVSSGTAPNGSSVTFSNTYTTKDQLTKNNSMTYTLKGYAGKKITAISMSMHSNKSAGTGKFSLVAGTTTLAEIASNTGFNQSAWYGSWTQSYVTVTPTMTKTDYVIQNGEDVVLTISASANSLFCESITITYE